MLSFIDIRWLIEAEVRPVKELPPKFITYKLGCWKGNNSQNEKLDDTEVFLISVPKWTAKDVNVNL